MASASAERHNSVAKICRHETGLCDKRASPDVGGGGGTDGKEWPHWHPQGHPHFVVHAPEK